MLCRPQFAIRLLLCALLWPGASGGASGGASTSASTGSGATASASAMAPASASAGAAAMATAAAPGAVLPADEDAPLEQPAPSTLDPAWARVRAQAARLTRHPDDPTLASDVAEGWLRLSRRHADGRLTGYAQAALQPWWAMDDPPAAVLFERASLRQTLHQFDAALLDLKRLLARSPLEARLRAQALLTRSTVLAVTGQHRLASEDCRALSALAEPAIASLCAAQLDALGPNAAHAADLLMFRLEHGGLGRDSSTRLWGDTVAAETTARLGRTAQARVAFEAALAEDGQDAYLLGAYADFLLDQQRAAEVRQLLAGHQDADGLLLRHAIALRLLKDPGAGAEATELGRRFAAARARGDATHKREESRYALQLLDDAKRALRLAKENWAVQKEPADVRVLAEAAAASGDAGAARWVQDWVRATGLADVALATAAPTRLAR